MIEMFDNYPQPNDYIPNNRKEKIWKGYSITRGTDVVLKFKVPFKLLNVSKVIIIFQQESVDNNIEINNCAKLPIVTFIKEVLMEDIEITKDGSIVSCTLSHDETLAFEKSTTYTKAKAQIIATSLDEKIEASKIFEITILDILENK